MARLNIDRQRKFEPKRIKKGRESLESMGFEIIQETAVRLTFKFKGHHVDFFPYSGWHSGKSITQGRGLQNLLNQIKPQS